MQNTKQYFHTINSSYSIVVSLQAKWQYKDVAMLKMYKL